MIVINPETPDDYAAIDQINSLAFGRENEGWLIRTLREEPGFIPELSLVARDQGNGQVGHILFSPITIINDRDSFPALALAPMAVLPDHQNKGIGTALVHHGLAICRVLGHNIIVVVGHPGFYPRFGFSSARAHGIEAPFPVPDEAFLVLELSGGSLHGVSGTVRYPDAFNNV